MFVSRVLDVLLRRWYLVVVGLLVVAMAGYLTWQRNPPTYTATGEVLLLPPASSVPKGANPYLMLDGLTPAGDVLSRSLTDPKHVADLQKKGLVGSFTVALDPDSPAPIVLVTAESTTAEGSVRDLGLVLSALPQSLRRLQVQADVPQGAFITTSTITTSSTPTQGIKGPLRSLIVAVGATGLVVLFGIAAVDVLLRRVPRRVGARVRHGGRASPP